MNPSIKEMTLLIRSLLARERPDLHLIGVLPTEGDGRVELLLTISGCHREPCRLTVNIPRATPRGMEEDVRSALLEALEQHAANR